MTPRPPSQPTPASLRAPQIPDDKTPARGVLKSLPTDPGERRRMHDDAAARAQTLDQRWEHTTQWLGVNTEEVAATKRIAMSSADHLVDLDARIMREFGRLSRQDSLHDESIIDERKAREVMSEKVERHDRMLMAKGAALMAGGSVGLVGIIKGVLELLTLAERFLK